jgi:membrane protein
VAGFALGNNDDPNLVADALSKMIKFIAPQLEQYEELTLNATEVNPTLVDTINNIIKASKSGSMGALGVFSLLFIVLLMFKGVEDTFNDIWGVRQGRSVLMRVVLYWTVLTLGAVLFFTAVALLVGGTFVNVFQERLPGGYNLVKSMSWSIPAFSFALLAVILTLFYRVIPNTRVFWRPAFVGAVVVTALLVMNNLFAILYVKRVVMEKNLYGGLALPLVMLSVLYVFWLCVLIGGTVSYAIQNVHFRNSQAAWSTLTESMRERLSLVVFLTICRRFRECLPPISASDLSTLLKVPTQLLNECLNRLVQTKLVTTVRPPPEATTPDYLYQPARPLNRITLHDFKTLDDNLGENPIGTSLEHIDPLISHYDIALSRLGEQEFFQKTVDQLFDEHSTDESRPPFAMGARRNKPVGA